MKPVNMPQLDKKLGFLQRLLRSNDALHGQIVVHVAAWLELWWEALAADETRSEALRSGFFSTFNPTYGDARRNALREAFFSGQPSDQMTAWCQAIDQVDRQLRRNHQPATRTFDEVIMLLHGTTAPRVPRGPDNEHEE